MLGGNLVTRSLVGTRVVGGTWSLGSGATWTLPALTLGGAVTGGGQSISGLGSLTMNAGGYLTFADAYWELVRLSTPAYAVVVTAAALVATVYRDTSQGFMVRGTTDLANYYSAFEVSGTGNGYFAGDLNLASAKVYKVNSVQVVGARVVDAKIDDAINAGAWDATTAGVLTACRDALVTHGLVAAA